MTSLLSCMLGDYLLVLVAYSNLTKYLNSVNGEMLEFCYTHLFKSGAMVAYGVGVFRCPAIDVIF